MSNEEEARFTLRERYLKMMNLVCSKPVEVELDDKAVVTGVLEAVKPDGSHLLLSKMKTPIGVHEHAVLRSSDVILMRTSVSDLQS